ncbi:MAG: hypothetical protein JST00_06450 [Deltaproteobacteria bacterium]|nr:hypothetical protein [Deltaproteobacteria bacterium]
MLLSRPRTALLFTLVLFFLVGPSSCNEEDLGGDSRFRDVAFANGTTDEALGAMLAVDALRDPARGPDLTSPTRGAHVPVAPPLVFRWKPLAVASVSNRPDFFFAISPRSRRAAAWSPFPLAHAHGLPFTGVAYLLVLQTPLVPEFRRVFTTETTYQPDDETWQALRNVRGNITVSVTAGAFDGDRLRAGASVFRSDVFAFNIGDE